MNQTNNDEILLDCFDTGVFLVIAYVQSFLDLIGIIFSIISIIIFRAIIKRDNRDNNFKGQMNKYLLVKSISELYLFTIDIFTFLYTCKPCNMKNSLIMQIWYVYFSWFGEESSLIFSSLLDVAATFDCLITIKNKCKIWQNNISFYIVVFISFIISISLELNVIFQFKIIKINITNIYDSNKTQLIYMTEYVEKSELGPYLLFSSLIRDWFTLFLLIILNIIILFSIKKLTKIRKSRSKKTSSRQIQKSIKAEKLKAKMILFLLFNFIFSHSVSFYLSLPIEINGNFICYDNIRWILLIIGSIFSVIIYYIFNKNFRNYICFCFINNNNSVHNLSLTK